jgi:predicted secreted protein
MVAAAALATLAVVTTQASAARPAAASGSQPQDRVRLVNVNSGKCLEIVNSGTAIYDVANQWTCHRDGSPPSGGTNQEWIRTLVAPNVYELANAYSTMCLNVTGVSASNLARIDQNNCTHEGQQRWRFINVSGAVFRVMSMSSGKCLEILGASLEDYFTAVQNTCTDLPNQYWRVDQVPAT